MADELSQLDEIVESDILDALGEKPIETNPAEDEILIEDLEEETPSETLQENEQEQIQEDKIITEDLIEETPQISNESEKSSNKLSSQTTKTEETQDIEEPTRDGSSTIIETSSSSIASLINELLKNKTIEITIKIKE